MEDDLYNLIKANNKHLSYYKKNQCYLKTVLLHKKQCYLTKKNNFGYAEAFCKGCVSAFWQKALSVTRFFLSY